MDKLNVNVNDHQVRGSMPASYIWKWSVIHQWPAVIRFLRAAARLMHPAEKLIDLQAGAVTADCQPTEQLTSRTRWVSQRQFQLLTFDSRLPFFNGKWMSCFVLNSPVFNFICYNSWNEFPHVQSCDHEIDLCCKRTWMHNIRILQTTYLILFFWLLNWNILKVKQHVFAP